MMTKKARYILNLENFESKWYLSSYETEKISRKKKIDCGDKANC